MAADKKGGRNEAEKRGIWTSGTGTLGQGRATTLALLCEMVEQNTTRAPGPNTYLRRARGRGLGPLLHGHSYMPSGMARARGKNPGPCPFPDPPMSSKYTTSVSVSPWTQYPTFRSVLQPPIFRINNRFLRVRL